MINESEIWNKINFKTKPTGALGRLEGLAFQICKVQNTLTPKLVNPSIFVFAGDHGIAKEGVSAYPQEVTWQMVLNFLNGGAAINVFANQHQIDLKIIDAGVNKDFENNSLLYNKKVNYGTKSFLHEQAISENELILCKQNAQELVQSHVKKTACNVIGFGEMGIGNTSSASLIMHCITGIELSKCVGKGTGLNDEQYKNKLQILSQAFQKNKPEQMLPNEILKSFGGFEIAMISEAMLESFKCGMLILVDGFIASAAFLLAHKTNPLIIDNAIFCHQSDESGHKHLLDYLGAKALLNLNMRLGEGTGCAIALPIVKSAVEFINNMASFESAGVSNK